MTITRSKKDDLAGFDIEQIKKSFSNVDANDNKSLIIKCATQIISDYMSSNPGRKDCKNMDDVNLYLNKLCQTLDTAMYHKSEQKLYEKMNINLDNTVGDDYVVCLEDGKKLKMLKRHLKTYYNMSLKEYKKKWGLDEDYPVVAPAYSKRRKQIATGPRRRK